MKQRGFTLLEILVAVFIIGIIAIIMVRGLQIVITTKDSLERNDTQLQQIQLTMNYVAGDMGNLINRSVRLSNGETQPPLMLHDDATQTLEFTRGGVSNPLGEQRSTVQHAAYLLKNNQLLRDSWSVLDQVATSKPQQRVLLKHVTSLKWQFLGSDNRYYTSWPATSANQQPLPKAVKISLTIDKKGAITRLFVVGNSMPESNEKKR